MNPREEGGIPLVQQEAPEDYAEEQNLFITQYL